MLEIQLDFLFSVYYTRRQTKAKKNCRLECFFVVVAVIKWKQLMKLVFRKSGIILWDLSRCKDNSGLFSAVEHLLPSATVGYANHSSALPTLHRFICLTCINPLNCFLLTHAD